MTTQKLKILNRLRTACYSIFLLICAYWLLDSGFPGYINWPILIIGLLLLVQIIFRFNKVDLVLGILLTMLSFYMLLAVTSDFIDHFNGSKPVKAFAMYFGFGYGIFGTAFVAALVILYGYYARRRHING